MNTAVRDTFERRLIAQMRPSFEGNPCAPTDPDTMTDAPTPRPGSFQYALTSLAVGESISKVRKLAGKDINVADYQAEMTALKRAMGNGLRNALVRANESTGGTYSLQVGDTLTSAGEFWCVAIITRTI